MTDRLDATPPRPEQAIADWHTAAWNDLAQRIAHVFPRTDSRANALSYLLGLLSPAERKNSWQLADITGAPTPYPFQHLLGRAEWSPDAVRDALLAYVPTILGHPEAIGVVDETGFLKKGSHSAGVTRHYTGTAGRVENCQVGVFLAYASPLGHTLLDRELYLPTSWTDDPVRCQRAGVPPDRTFATKPELARQMIARAAAAGITFAWITGDTVYGDDRPVRHWLEAQSQPYVLGMARTEHLWIAAQSVTLTDLAASLADTAWERHSCGDGSQGPRWYDWAAVALNAPPQAGFQRWVVLRRPVDDPQDWDAYRVFARSGTTLAAVARVVGARWTIAACFQTAKTAVGLDHYEVRSWTGWYRHITLALWAQAYLAGLRPTSPTPVGLSAPPKKESPPRSLARCTAQRGLRPC